jgi:hypothetical protein
MMMKHNDRKPDFEERAKKLAPYAVIILVLAVGVIFIIPQFGAVRPVQAQVNLGRVGNVVTETVGEAASETAGEYAQTQNEIENPTLQPAGNPEETAPAETPATEPVAVNAEEEVLSEEEAQAMREQFYTSSEGIGGKHFTELNDIEIRAGLDEIITTLSGSRNDMFVDALLPIFQRFQIMVKPPVDQVNDWALPPWESGERRYSPFDMPGMAGAGAGLELEPLPPFPNIEVYGAPLGENKGPDITAAMVAMLLRLKGVLADGNEYVAIILVYDQEKRLKVGEEVWNSGQQSYIVTEIDMSSVKIQAADDSSDVGVVHFGTRAQIQNFSISY